MKQIHKLTTQLTKMLVTLLQHLSAMKPLLSYYMIYFWNDLNPQIITYIVVHGHACTNKTLILGYTIVLRTLFHAAMKNQKQSHRTVFKELHKNTFTKSVPL